MNLAAVAKYLPMAREKNVRLDASAANVAHSAKSASPGTDDDLRAIHAKLDRIIEALSSGARRFVSLRRAGGDTDLSVPSLRRLIAAGKLQAHRHLSGKILIDRRELEALIVASTVKLRGGRGQKLKH